MWITQAVNLPDALLDAQRDGKLVVFAGAGVSMGAPANFPNFAELLRESVPDRWSEMKMNHMIAILADWRARGCRCIAEHRRF